MTDGDEAWLAEVQAYVRQTVLPEDVVQTVLPEDVVQTVLPEDVVFRAIAILSERRKYKTIPPIIHAHNITQSRKNQKKFAAAVEANEKGRGGAYGFGYATIEEVNEWLPSSSRIHHSGFGLWIGGPYSDSRVYKRKISRGFLKDDGVEYHLTQEGYQHWEAQKRDEAAVQEARVLEAEKVTHEERLLQAAEAAVKVKAEAEANPDDPLSWLRMAEAMDAANRHEEAERCRKTAMELIEKKTL
jgi:hypothetical protein